MAEIQCINKANVIAFQLLLEHSYRLSINCLTDSEGIHDGRSNASLSILFFSILSELPNGKTMSLAQSDSCVSNYMTMIQIQDSQASASSWRSI